MLHSHTGSFTLCVQVKTVVSSMTGKTPYGAGVLHTQMVALVRLSMKTSRNAPNDEHCKVQTAVWQFLAVLEVVLLLNSFCSYMLCNPVLKLTVLPVSDYVRLCRRAHPEGVSQVANSKSTEESWCRCRSQHPKPAV